MTNSNIENQQKLTGKFSQSKARFIRNFLTIFLVIFTCSILPNQVESLLWVHFVLSLQLLQAKKANLREASIHYLSGFLILLLSQLTFEQKVIDIILSITPYFYYEVVLQHTSPPSS